MGIDRMFEDENRRWRDKHIDRAVAAEKQVSVLEAQLGNSDRWRRQGYERECELMKRVAELEAKCSSIEKDWNDQYSKRISAEKRVAKLEKIFKNEYKEDCNCGYCKAYRRVISDEK